MGKLQECLYSVHTQCAATKGVRRHASRLKFVLLRLNLGAVLTENDYEVAKLMAGG